MSNPVVETQIRQLLKTHQILLDASFAMEPGFRQFVIEYREAIRGRLLVPDVVRSELLGLTANAEPSRRTAARRAIDVIDGLAGLGELQIRGESSDREADLVIQRVVEQHLLTHDWLVLTNDRPLMLDLRAKKEKRSVRTLRSLQVVRLEPKSQRPELFDPDSGSKPAATPHDPVAGPAAGRPARPRPAPKPFRSGAGLAPGQDSLLTAECTLREGARVRLRQGPDLTLGPRFAAGGEAEIFAVEGAAELLCKLYRPGQLTVGKRDKVMLMLTREVDHPAICWPVSAVEDRSGLFRGYLMRRAPGEPLASTLFLPEEFKEAHPDWTRRESVRLAMTLLETLQYLHRLNVLVGDLNPGNLLFSDPRAVAFVDCDSFQVEGYPCPVGTPTFLAPELHGQRLGSVLRTLEHELFAVATLIFMILLPGKPPYSHAGGGDGAANVRRRKFPYTRNASQVRREAPPGPWTLCWSHLSKGLKDAFLRSFDPAQGAQQRGVQFQDCVERASPM